MIVVVTVRVLVVDDDRAIRESLARALSLEGYEVSTATDGVEAIVSARRPDLDVVVLDVMMPAVDGLGVCRVLCADGIRTPILMLTARPVSRSGRGASGTASAGHDHRPAASAQLRGAPSAGDDAAPAVGHRVHRAGDDRRGA